MDPGGKGIQRIGIHSGKHRIPLVKYSGICNRYFESELSAFGIRDPQHHLARLQGRADQRVRII